MGSFIKSPVAVGIAVRGKGNFGVGRVAAGPVQRLGHCFQQLVGGERLGQGEGGLKPLVLDQLLGANPTRGQDDRQRDLRGAQLADQLEP